MNSIIRPDIMIKCFWYRRDAVSSLTADQLEFCVIPCNILFIFNLFFQKNILLFHHHLVILLPPSHFSYPYLHRDCRPISAALCPFSAPPCLNLSGPHSNFPSPHPSLATSVLPCHASLSSHWVRSSPHLLCSHLLASCIIDVAVTPVN